MALTIYSRRPCLFWGMGLVLGIIIAKSGWSILWIALGWVLSGVLLVRSPRGRIYSSVFASLLISFLLGAAAWSWHQRLDADDIARLVKGPVLEAAELKCQVISEVKHQLVGHSRRVSFIARAQALSHHGQSRPVSGKVLVTMFREEPVALGDQLLLTGSLRKPVVFGNTGRISYVDVMASQRVWAAFHVKKNDKCRIERRNASSVTERVLAWARGRISEVYARYLSAGEAGLMCGLITGDRHDITEHVKDIFWRTGTTHLLAVSGLNVALVAAGVFFVMNLLPFGRSSRMVLAVILIFGYSALAGGASPVLRSAIMCSICILAGLFEREADPLNTLSIAAGGILLFNPSQLFDIGFQLSFIGVLSLVLIGPALAGLFPENRLGRIGCEYLGVSMAAFIGTTAITAYYFGTITPIGLLANIPAVPLVAVITGLGSLLLLVSPIPFLAGLIAVLLKFVLNLLVFLLFTLTHIPGGFFYLERLPEGGVILIYYLFLSGLICLTRRARKVHTGWSLAM